MTKKDGIESQGAALVSRPGVGEVMPHVRDDSEAWEGAGASV